MIPGSANALLLGSAAGGYEIERSLRFNSSDSAYLSRTPASAGNRKTWTWAGWVKRSKSTATSATLFGASPGGGPGDQCWIDFTNLDQIQVFDYIGSTRISLITQRLFRDFSAWYHIVVAVDTTQATDSNRVKLYVNGAQETVFSTASYPTQNLDTVINGTNLHSIGSLQAYTTYYLDAYLAEIHFCDGTAYDASAFGEFSATTGVWMPKRFAGTYGSQGWKLDFADNSAATATTLGKDSSGNGNNWTPNNLSVTAGAGNDSLVDSPTNYGTDTGAGGEVRGNYATLNTLNKGSNVTLLNGNLDYSYSAAGGVVTSTFPIPAGKWYWELSNVATYALVGCYQSGGLGLSYLGSSGVSFGFTNGGFAASSGVTAPTGSISSFSGGDVIGFAFDKDAGTLNVYKNNTLALSYTGLSGEWYPAVGQNAAGSGSFNFGQRPFAYTAPSGFKALCTANLPAPTIVKPSTVMDTLLWTGNSATRTLTGLNFDPDLIWVKIRSDAKNHVIQDSIRGFTTAKKLSSSGNFIEGDASNLPDWAGYISGTSSTGFSLDKSGTGSDDWVHVNKSGNTYVGWAWDAGSSTVTNTAGTISAQVRANASAGFSIATATYFGGTVGHGLGVAPAMVIAKLRDVAPNNWFVYHKDAIAAGTVANNSYLVLNGTSAVINAGSNIWNVTSTTISSNASLSGNGVYYSFAPVAGYSAFGSYTGNGSTDGPMVFTNTRPRWIMIKRTDSIGNWTIIDAAREGYNVDNDPLYPNTADAEGTADLADIVSNGFKLRSTDASVNASAGIYVYACFAEAPFSLARAR